MAMPPPPPPPSFGWPSGGGAGGRGKPPRKEVERIRRSQMNALYSRLDTLVRDGGAPAERASTRPDRLEAAATYIRQTADRVERLKERRRELTSTQQGAAAGAGTSSSAGAPEVEVQHLGSGLHVILVTGAAPGDGASFHRAVRAVEEAGGEVQNAHFSVVGARAIYTIHTLVTGQQGGIERVVQTLRGALRGDA